MLNVLFFCAYISLKKSHFTCALELTDWISYPRVSVWIYEHCDNYNWKEWDTHHMLNCMGHVFRTISRFIFIPDTLCLSHLIQFYSKKKYFCFISLLIHTECLQTKKKTAISVGNSIFLCVLTKFQNFLECVNMDICACINISDIELHERTNIN